MTIPLIREQPRAIGQIGSIIYVVMRLDSEIIFVSEAKIEYHIRIYDLP